MSEQTGYKWYEEKPFTVWPTYVPVKRGVPRPGSDELLKAPSLHGGVLYPRNIELYEPSR